MQEREVTLSLFKPAVFKGGGLVRLRKGSERTWLAYSTPHLAGCPGIVPRHSGRGRENCLTETLCGRPRRPLRGMYSKRRTRDPRYFMLFRKLVQEFWYAVLMAEFSPVCIVVPHKHTCGREQW